MLQLSDFRVIDLTHLISDEIPIWPGDPEIKIIKWADYQVEKYFINQLTIGEHTGTHIGTPNTFFATGRTIEQYTLEELIKPAVVINICQQALEDNDYQLSVQDILMWEKRNGSIPKNSYVILYTGWQQFWTNSERYFGIKPDGFSHTPGFSLESVKFLVNEYFVVGLGIDTHGVDPGLDIDFLSSREISSAGGVVLQCLCNLDKLPSTGTILVVAPLPITNGSGSAARIFGYTA